MEGVVKNTDFVPVIVNQIAHSNRDFIDCAFIIKYHHCIQQNDQWSCGSFATMNCMMFASNKSPADLNKTFIELNLSNIKLKMEARIVALVNREPGFINGISYLFRLD